MYRKGYFMTIQDERAAKANALLEYEEQRQRFALLKNEAEKFAKQFENVAGKLRNSPELLSPDVQTIASDNQRLIQLIADIKTTRDEVNRLRAVLTSLGYSPRD